MSKQCLVNRRAILSFVLRRPIDERRLRNCCRAASINLQNASSQSPDTANDNVEDNRVRRNSSPLQTRMIEHSGSSVCYLAVCVSKRPVTISQYCTQTVTQKHGRFVGFCAAMVYPRSVRRFGFHAGFCCEQVPVANTSRCSCIDIQSCDGTSSNPESKNLIFE